MATYSNNTTIKIDGGMISGFSAAQNASLIYTVPNNSYFILSGWNLVNVNSSILYLLRANGTAVFGGDAFGVFNAGSNPGKILDNNIYLPAGTRIYLYNGSLVNSTCFLLGQLFTNTP